MANFPSVTAAGAFESTAVQNAIKTLAEQAVASRLTALDQTTGWRSVTPATGWTGRVLVYRVGSWVKVIFDGVTPAAGASGTIVVLPNGTRTSAPSGTSGRLLLHTTAGVVRRGSYGGSSLSVVGAETGVALYGEVDFITVDAFPSPLPGSPA